MNTYGYVGGNPLNATDPLGLVISVSQNGNVITITTTIGIHGNAANSSLAAKWEKAINATWNNRGSNIEYGKCKINFDVKVMANQFGVNNIYVLTKGTPNQWTDTNRSFVVNNDQGVWYAHASGNIIAHEFGHIANIGDKYNDVRDPVSGSKYSVPWPTWENTIMGDASNTVDFWDVDALMLENGLNCGCE